jgi:probable HAF family extracellular repeat protein
MALGESHMKHNRNIMNSRHGTSARGTLVSVVLGAALVSAAGPAASAQTFTGIGFLAGGGSSVVNGISADGSTVVGRATDSTVARRAIRWTRDEGMLDLGVLAGATRAEAIAVNADGSVVVGISDDGVQGGFRRAFLWTRTGGMRDLGTLPGGTTSSAAAVNADGTVVVGTAATANGSRAFRWTEVEGMQDLGVLPLPGEGAASNGSGVSSDGSVIAGSSSILDPQSAHLFRWTTAGGMEDLGVLPNSYGYVRATAISGDGSTIVGYDLEVFPSNEQYAIRWTRAAGIELLDDPKQGLSASTAVAVSADGSVIVGVVYGVGAVRWTQDGRMTIESVLTAAGIDLSGWSLGVGVIAVSADGLTMAGTGTHESRSEGWVASIRPVCRADFNGDDLANSQDFFDFLSAFFAADPDADFNADGTVDSQDFFDFLTAFFAGCA